MPGALLRTGTLREFRALGVDGQPVHGVALQLREAIRLKMHREAADCLAIPQTNEAGDRIDWYAPIEGDVVPWSAATPEEREQAHARLEAMQAQLRATGESMRNDAQNREKQVFGRLLEKALHFPDANHVYLVDGKPVITFWGFTGQQAAQPDDPLACLQTARPAAAVAADIASPPPVTPAVAARSGWRRWLWLLLLPLLLLLLLFVMRACAPNVELPFELSHVDLPGLPAEEKAPLDARRHEGVVGVEGISGRAGVAGVETEALEDMQVPGKETAVEDVPIEEALSSEPGASELATDDPALDESAAEEAAADEATAEELPEPAAEAEPEAKPEAAQEPPVPPQLDEEKAAEDPQAAQQDPAKAQDAAKPMSIPPEAQKSGSTRFLDGNWQAGAGIQDAKTGKPLQLGYDFKDGQGRVSIRRDDGVQCSGAVNASMQGGNLAIASQGQANCSDGSRYRLPEVTCKPDARSAADCTGHYGDQEFPMSIRQGGN
ncbi:SrfA family protein [Azotobacter chroococcum]|uniref:SrfA family protein n=1 Tax=Azotobacter chroococcum TaxID=353 RepID=UPI0010AEE697|nr:SrfA family protein [Azotobacter chroococcum]TKD39250.1 Breakpoint cluster region protein [Azotobacter chroococcum]